MHIWDCLLALEWTRNSHYSVVVPRALAMLLEAGADSNARENFSTVFKTAQKKQMRAIDGWYIIEIHSLTQWMIPTVVSSAFFIVNWGLPCCHALQGNW